jgi:trigger factor
LNSTEAKANCLREIQVEIPADVVTRETDSLVQKYQKLARVPGFRRGKVPATLVRQRYAEELKNDVVENLIPKYLQQETEKQGLKPVSAPRISDWHIAEGEPLRFKATFEVLPSIEVSGYKDLCPEPKSFSVSDEEVEAALNNLREQQATYTVVENRPLQDGDYAQVAFTGVPKRPGESGEDKGKPVKVEDVLIEIGGANTVPGFTENLRGAQAGEERSFEVNYPEDFADSRLAGTAFTYTVTVKGIKQKHLPELNDNLAREVGDLDNLEALKQRVRESLLAGKEHEAEQEAKEKIIDQLVERHEFPVPEALVERQVQLRLERGLRALSAQGMRTEDLKKMDFARLRAGQRESALKEVKVSLILDRIAELEKIEASDEEVNQEVEALAHQARQPVEEVRTRLTRDGALDRIRNRLRSEKTLDYLFRRSA